MTLEWNRYGSEWVLHDKAVDLTPNQAIVNTNGWATVQAVHVWSDGNWHKLDDFPLNIEECKAFVFTLVRMGSTQGEPHA